MLGYRVNGGRTIVIWIGISLGVGIFLGIGISLEIRVFFAYPAGDQNNLHNLTSEALCKEWVDKSEQEVDIGSG